MELIRAGERGPEAKQTDWGAVRFGEFDQTAKSPPPGKRFGASCGETRRDTSALAAGAAALVHTGEPGG